MSKFAIDQKVTSEYYDVDHALIVKGVNTESEPIEYWLQNPDGSRETHPERVLSVWVKPFNPLAGESYTNSDYDFDVKVLARFSDTDGTAYVAYQWTYGGRINATATSLDRFKKNYPNLMEAWNVTMDD